MQLSLDIGFVDFERAVLVVDGEERRLRPLELKLLAYMADHPERVLPPEELLREVWGYADGVESRTLYATVNRLRLALERDPGHPTHILTVPRLGYRFRPTEAAEVEVRSALPRTGGPLIGREAELDALRALVRVERLVTLRGAAGVGKSRLALELARTEPGRIVWCGLGNARTADDVLRALSEALGLGAGPTGATARVAAALGGQADTLLVLDDADLAEAALIPLLRGWMAGPTPRMLVTSRSRLHLGEAHLALGPLRVPARAGEARTASALLLQARVHARQPDLTLDPTEAWVTPLLQALGGLPLAIELAAPWLTVMGGPDLLEHLEAGVHALSGPRGDEVGRHRSLGEALGWSWPLLAPWEREALVQCACFTAAFDLRAANAIVDLGGLAEAPPLHDILLRLVERSWLRVESRPYGQVFSFYAGQREFVASKAAPGRLAESEGRHVAFHAALSSRHDLETLYVVGGVEWSRLRARTPDLRAARAKAEGADRVRLTLALARVFLAEGPLDLCLTLLDEALGGVEATTDRLSLLHYRAIAQRHLGQAAAARETLAAALMLASGPAFQKDRGRLLRALGVLEMYHGDPGAAASHLEEALAVLGGASPLDTAIALAEAGTLAFLVGDHARAVTLLERGLGPLREAGAGWVYAVYLVNLGVVELMDDRLDSAAQHLGEALTLQRRFGSARFEALALGNLALVEERRGDVAAAHQHLDDAVALTRLTGDRSEAATLLSNRGLVHLREAKVGAAAEALEQASALAEALQIPRLQAEVAARRARVCIARREWMHARVLLDHAEDLATRLRFSTELAEVRAARMELDTAHPEPR